MDAMDANAEERSDNNMASSPLGLGLGLGLDLDLDLDLEQELQLALELPNRDPYYFDPGPGPGPPVSMQASPEELFKSLFDLSTVNRPQANSHSHSHSTNDLITIGGKTFSPVKLGVNNNKNKPAKLRKEVVTHQRMVLQGKTTVMKTEKYVQYIDEEEQSYKSQSMQATTTTLLSPSRLPVKLNIFKSCHSSDNTFGNPPSMPSLRMEMFERESNYSEPMRDRDKAWMQTDIIDGVLTCTHDTDVLQARMSMQEMGLGKYDSRSAHNLPPLYWSSAFQQLMRKTKLYRKSRLISETRCIVDVYGLGINGRVFSEGSSSGRLLIVECYSIWNSQKYVILLTCNQLRTLFSGQQEFLKPGHKEDIVQCIVDYLYFTYTVQVPPPLVNPDAAKVDANVEEESNNDGNNSGNKDSSSNSNNNSGPEIKITSRDKLKPPPPIITETVEHTQRLQRLPKKFYPNNITSLIDMVVRPSESIEEITRSPAAPPIITQYLHVGLTKRESVVLVRQREEAERQRLIAEEEARKQAAWLAIQKRKRGLEATHTLRWGARSVVLTAYRHPSRPTLVKLFGHVAGECVQLKQSIRFAELQDRYRIELNYLKWAPEFIAAVLRKLLKDIRISYSDVVDGRDMAMSIDGIVGTQEQVRRLDGCADVALVRQLRQERQDKVVQDSLVVQNTNTNTNNEKPKRKRKPTDFFEIKQLSSKQRKHNSRHSTVFAPPSCRKPGYLLVCYDDLLMHNYDVNMSHVLSPLYRLYRCVLPTAMGVSSLKTVQTVMPVSANRRRDIGRGRLLVQKIRKVDGVLCTCSFRLISKTVPVSASESGSEPSMRDIPEWYTYTPPVSVITKSTNNNNTEGKENDDQTTTDNSTHNNDNNDNDDISVSSAALHAQRIAEIAEGKLAAFRSHAPGFRVELEVYIPMAAAVATLGSTVSIAANTVYCVEFSKQDIFHILSDELLAFEVCKVGYQSFYEYASVEEVSSMEQSWERAAKVVMDKCLWVRKEYGHVVSSDGVEAMESKSNNDDDNNTNDNNNASTDENGTQKNGQTQENDSSCSFANFQRAQSTLRIEGRECSPHIRRNIVSTEEKKNEKEYYVVPSWSLIVFSRALKIAGEDNPGTSKIFQVYMWQRESELGVVAYDLDPQTRGVFFTQASPISQAEQLELTQFMVEPERSTNLAMYLTIELRYDELEIAVESEEGNETEKEPETGNKDENREPKTEQTENTENTYEKPPLESTANRIVKVRRFAFFEAIFKPPPVEELIEEPVAFVPTGDPEADAKALFSDLLVVSDPAADEAMLKAMEEDDDGDA